LVVAAFGVGCSPAPEDPGPLATARSELTVDQEIAKATCATSSSVVQGLSDQILDEIAKCLKPGVLVKVGNPKIADSSVHPYLVKAAYDALVKSTTAKGGTIHVSSMFRSVAQQYFLFRRSACYPAVADPGTSNHETGIAIDVSDPDNSTWKATLEANGFKWLGSFDRFHFDYVGAGSVNLRGQDVLAFQRLWNRNNPTDKIGEDGSWGPQTEARMKKAPAGGFAIGADCGTPPPPPAKPWPELRLDVSVQGVDRIVDGASAGTIDTLEGDDSLSTLVVENSGDAAAKGVVVGLWTESPFLLPSHWDLEVEAAGAWTKDALAGDPTSDTFTVGPFDLAVGQKKRVRLQLKSARYSLGPSTPSLRAWVKSVPGVYDKPEFGAKPTNVDGRQTWNSGDLRTETGLDVFSRVRWSFDGATAEGWTGSTGTLDASAPTAGLVVTPGAGGVTLLGPTTSFGAESYPSLALKVLAGSGTARVSFAGAGGAFSDPISVELAPGAVSVDLAGSPAYRGTITQLRIELPATKVAFDDIRLGGAIPPSSEDATAEGGCGCRFAGRDRGSDAAVAAFGALLLLVTRRRR